MAENITDNTNAAETKAETNNGKLIAGGIAAVIGGIVGYGLVGGAAIIASAVVFGLVGAALGAVFDRN